MKIDSFIAKKEFRNRVNRLLLALDAEADNRKLLTIVAEARPEIQIIVSELIPHLQLLGKICFDYRWKKFQYTCYRHPYSRDLLKKCINALLQVTK